MDRLECPFVIGTAGHIDHGKTTLVKAISGIDCDRLSEEKKRGITIELGFAPLVLPSGKTVSIVDVPGHEKFIRQMVAGAVGIDAVMFVVAADDGVMSQTREHLEILTLLGKKKGLVVINKVDLVDNDILEIVKEEISELIRGTFLENAPVICTSSYTKVGLSELKEALQMLVDSYTQRRVDGSFFLYVDRAFHISGFGTVITGTILKGVINDGDDLEVLPSKIPTKVRSIQVHDAFVKTATAGQRVAINLSNISLNDVKRGDAVATKGRFSSTDCIDVEVNVLPSAVKAVKHWERLHLHIGTSDTVARLSLMDRENILPGDRAVAQLILEKPVAVSINTNFILRTYSPIVTNAGGKVLVAYGDRPKSKDKKIALLKYLETISSGLDSRERIKGLIDYRGMLNINELLLLTELSLPETRGQISSLEMKNEIGIINKSGETILLSKTKMEEINKKLVEKLIVFHKEHPELKGMAIDEISRTIMVQQPRFAKEMLSLFAKLKWITMENEKIRLNSFESFDQANFLSDVYKVKEKILNAQYEMLTIDDLIDLLSMGAKEISRIISYLKEQKELVIIGQEFLLPKEIFLDFKTRIQAIDGDLTLGKARDLTNSSRKYMLPLLEYFDSIGITRRVGDKRIILKRK